MSTHTGLQTTSISTSNAWYAGEGKVGSVSADDTIVTNGYELENDGGGATFTIRNKEIGETPDGVFILGIAGNNALVAELNISNGAVIVDQLGFLGHDDRLHLENVDTTSLPRNLEVNISNRLQTLHLCACIFYCNRLLYSI